MNIVIKYKALIGILVFFSFSSFSEKEKNIEYLTDGDSKRWHFFDTTHFDINTITTFYKDSTWTQKPKGCYINSGIWFFKNSKLILNCSGDGCITDSLICSITTLNDSIFEFNYNINYYTIIIKGDTIEDIPFGIFLSSNNRYAKILSLYTETDTVKYISEKYLKTNVKK